jgi:FkbM family methyltransferase
MQNELSYPVDFAVPAARLSISSFVAKHIEQVKLRHRAEKYQYVEDPGGIACIQKFIRKGQTVFDIGAHKAGYLYFFQQQLSNSGGIHAFEPQRPLYKYLVRIRELFGWENLNVLPYAVSDQEGEAMLGIPRNGHRHSSPCATIIESRMDFDFQRREKVATISLDHYCRARDLRPDFIKVDVEGNEFNVFLGAQQLLRTTKPPLLFECEARFVGEERLLETFKLLRSHGYRGHFISGRSVFPIEGFSVQRFQQNGIRPYCNNFIFE